MIFITGDTHRDFRRFSKDVFYEQTELTKTDFVIVCGDFGIWDDSKEERYLLDELNARSFTTLFVSGNHDNYDMLAALPVTKWNGGKVQYLRDSVIHLMRGQAFAIDGRKFFTMGGASSHDIQDGILEPDDPDYRAKRRKLDARNAMYRVNHKSWWAEELPSDAEYAEALKNFEAHGWKTDYIITHCLPTNVANILGGGLYAPDRLTDFLDDITKRCDFRYMFCGHYHVNRQLLHKYVVLYEQILRLNERTSE